MKKIVLLSVVASSMLLASGYKIPEQSTASIAKAGAHVANTTSADTSYFNPAAMSTMENRSQLEAGLTYIHLPAIHNETGILGVEKSEKENVFIPTFHYVSPKVGDYTFGLSMVAPAGLSKRWKDPVPKASAEEFTLRVIELNPTVAYAVNDDFSIGGGIRLIYADGVVRSNSADLNVINPTVPSASRNLEGDTIELGYNLAMHYHPNSEWKVGLTYRSKIDLNIEGNADLFAAGDPDYTYSGGASVTVPVPAVLALGVAYDINEKTNIEFVFDRTYWSALKEFDFNYDSTQPIFDTPIPKNWKDVNTYRVGLTHKYSDILTLMCGFAIDKNPVPDDTLGYELPASDAKIYSLGFDYKIDEQTNFGAAYLYSDAKSRSVINANVGAADFTEGGAHLLGFSLGYKF